MNIFHIMMGCIIFGKNIFPDFIHNTHHVMVTMYTPKTMSFEDAVANTIQRSLMQENKHFSSLFNNNKALSLQDIQEISRDQETSSIMKTKPLPNISSE